VGDHEIELPQLRKIHSRDVARQQLQIVEAQGVHTRAPMVDLHLRQIDAHDTRPRMCRSKRDQVASGATADFEHPRGCDLGCFQAEQISDSGQLSRRRLRV